MSITDDKKNILEQHRVAERNSFDIGIWILLGGAVTKFYKQATFIPPLPAPLYEIIIYPQDN